MPRARAGGGARQLQPRRPAGAPRRRHRPGRGDAVVDAVTTADDVEASKPAGDLFAVGARRVGAQRPVAVGDSPWDARAAHAAGLEVVLVRSGGFCDELLRAEAPDAPLHDDAADLLARLDGSPLGR
ncbi:HAD family hydrolase [Quadrisphaera sp. KR29]|uniref:HAD family hydrolase n=1 Tax=Quadrisphaera sp. KR29 TaxID=3461391 RepID=UPI004044F8C7